jgi:multimeric flavodoxin WrbA/uncharacterized Zn finger protein (UPF0148 family)
MGNSEVLLKEALMGAEEIGAEVEIIRLLNLKINPCLGCLKCHDTGKCVQKNDHIPFLIDKMAGSDGIILSAPAYSFTPPGFLLVIRDRLIENYGRTLLKSGREVKSTRGAHIVVGGSNWVNLCLPLMEWCLFPHGKVKLVDQMVVPFTAEPGIVALNKWALARARGLGRNMGEAVKLPIDEVKYIGEAIKVSDDEVKFFSESMQMPTDEIKYETDIDDVCPLCHSNVLNVHGGIVSCAICDIKGRLEIQGNKIKVVFDDVELQRARHSPWEQKRHHHYVQMSSQIIDENKQKVNKRLAKYKEYKTVTVPPHLETRSKVQFSKTLVQ